MPKRTGSTPEVSETTQRGVTLQSSSAVPVELDEWNMLRNTVTDVTNAIAAGESLSDSDVATLNRLPALFEAYKRAAWLAWDGAHNTPEVISILGESITGLIKRVRSDAAEISTETASAPVHDDDSEAVRNLLAGGLKDKARERRTEHVRQLQSIKTSLMFAIDAARQRITAADTKQARIASAVRYWLAINALRHVAAVIVLILRDLGNNETSSPYLQQCFRLFYNLQNHYKTGDSPDLLAGIAQQDWLPEVQRQLAEESPDTITN